jgi:hypothetical protein
MLYCAVRRVENESERLKKTQCMFCGVNIFTYIKTYPIETINVRINKIIKLYNKKSKSLFSSNVNNVSEKGGSW